jgi:hypothetical protein
VLVVAEKHIMNISTLTRQSYCHHVLKPITPTTKLLLHHDRNTLARTQTLRRWKPFLGRSSHLSAGCTINKWLASPAAAEPFLCELI